MHISRTQKIIFAILLFLVSGYVIYSTYFAGPSNPAVTATLPDVNGIVAVDGSLSTSTIDSEGQDIIDLAYKLNAISIDTNLFASPLFTYLKDFDAPLLAESLGRANPFSQIGIEGSFQSIVVVATTTTSKPSNTTKLNSSLPPTHQ